MARPVARLAPLLLLLASAVPWSHAAAPRACAVADGIVRLAGNGLLGADGRVAWSAPDGAAPAALACDGARAAVAWDRGRDHEVAVLARQGEGWTAAGTLRAPGAVHALALSGDRVAAVFRRGDAWGLAIGTPGGRGRFEHQHGLPGEPAALGVAQDGTALLVAVGREIRTFRLDTGGTWLVFTFDAPVTALDVRPEIPWFLVGLGERIVAVDPRDPAFRGALPARLETRMPEPVRALAWGDARGTTILAALGDGTAVAVLAADGLQRLGTLRGAAPAEGFLVAAGAPAAVAADGTVHPLALPADVAAARPPRWDRPRPAPAPAPPAVAAPPPPRTAPAPAPTPAPAPAPAPSPVPAPAPEPAPVQVLPPLPPDALPDPLPGGTIAGVIDGAPEAVSEVVLAGPDSILNVQARAIPRTIAGRAVYRADGLPPGRYRVTPMGRAGGSVRAQPPMITVTITATAGARADFVVRGGL